MAISTLVNRLRGKISSGVPGKFSAPSGTTFRTPGETPGEPGKHLATPAASCVLLFSDDSRTRPRRRIDPLQVGSVLS